MSPGNIREQDLWEQVTRMLGNGRIVLGQHWSYNVHNDPKRLAFVLSRYKFAAKMACKGRRVLELGCSEGLGAPILSEFADRYTGIDLDSEAVAAAVANWQDDRCTFVVGDFLGRQLGTFDSIVSLDVIEHIDPAREPLFFDTIRQNLDTDGICVIGTPNLTSAPYASAASQQGHVNLFDAGRLRRVMEQVFHNVFLFGMNDEVVHTGFSPMAHYLLAVGCYRRKDPL